jgi:RHS repeat-associated protein
MPGRSSNSSSYKYGAFGYEKDDEVSGSGNSYTTTFRQYDPRLGRWKSLDPQMQKYPYLSPYSYAANSPLIFVDTEGDTIRLVGTAAEQTKMLAALQNLTNDELAVKANGEVIIKTLGGQNPGKTLTSGTKLIRRLNKKGTGTKTVEIQIGPQFQEVDDNGRNAINGVGSDATVDFAPTHLPNLLVTDPATGLVVPEKSNETTNFAHELIHAERSMRGEAIDYSIRVDVPYDDGTGTIINNVKPKEEHATVGKGGFNKPKDITENDIRKEQGVKERAAY